MHLTTRLIPSLVFVSFLLLCHKGMAQFKMPDGSPPASEVKTRKSGAWKVWLAHEGYRPTYEAGGSNEVIGKSASFMEAFTVVADLSQQLGSGGGYMLLAKAEENAIDVAEYFGWVDARVIVQNQNPIPDAGSRLYQKLRVVNTKESIAEALRMESEDAKEDEQRIKDLTDVVVTHVPRDPKDKSEEKHRYKTSNLFFVYGETETHVLIGSADSFSSEDPARVVKGWVPANRVSRWNTRLALEWFWDTTPAEPTRRAKDSRKQPFPRRAEKGRVFTAYKDDGDRKFELDEEQARANAKKYLRGELRDDKILDAATGFPERFAEVPSLTDPLRNHIRQVFGVDTAAPDSVIQRLIKRGIKTGDLKSEKIKELAGPMELESDPWDHGATRMPILAEPEQSIYPANNLLFKVGWVGGFTGSQLDLDELDKALAAAQDAAKRLDLLIVIDHTGSMSRYFPIVAQAVAELFLDAQGQDRDLRVSVCYYGDEKSNDAFVTAPLRSVNLTDKSKVEDVRTCVQKYLSDTKRDGFDPKYFQNHPPKFETGDTVVELLQEVHSHPKQGGLGSRESVFLGIQKAIAAASFRAEAQKLLILLGDMGDLSGEGSVRNADTTIREKVASFLTYYDVPIHFYAIHTEQQSRQRHPDAELFEEQMTSIAEFANKTAKAKLPRELRATEGDIAEYFPASDLARVRKLIGNQFQKLKERSDRIEEAMVRLRQGEFHTELGAAELRQLELVGVDAERLRNTKGAQAYAEGFVWKYGRESNTTPQIRTRVMLNEGEMSEIIYLLEQLVGNHAGRGGGSIPVGRLVARLIEEHAGEEGRSLADLHFAKLKLPVRSEILKLTVDKAREYVATEESKQELMIKLARLKDIKEGLMKEGYEFKAKRVDNSGVKEEVLEFSKEWKEERFFRFPGDPLEKKWYWLDLEKEIP